MNKSFIDLFEEQVEKTPGNIAVVFEQQQLSFSELNEKSNQLAHQLRSFGVKEDVLVPLFIERGLNMVVGLLGIMKAGGAYVPIDIDFPQERISYMLQDSQAPVLVCSQESRKKVPSVEGIASVEIDALPDGPKNNLSEKTLPHHLAYVIYTSGSTGMPKGVMIEHRNLVDYITGLFEKTGINNCHSFALVSTIATDLGNTVIYSSLACGGTLHVFTKETVSNIELLQQYFDEHKIECLKIVPSHWRALSPDVNLLLPGKLLIFGGEALPEKIIEDIRSSGSNCRVVNHYGPTETTIGKLLHLVEPDAKYEYTVPIGKPFSNTKVLVLTKNLKLCPIGVPGQLYITGDGVARGYWNNPELTKEKFIQNPFAKQGYSIMYDTGDLVKYLADGNISFIGRADNQVKIRGYRIELGEIENVLQQSDLVSQAAILAKDDKQGNKTLVGYIIPNGVFQREGILTFAKEKLPEYMVPAVLVEMDKFPLTANGKIDRNALPDPDEKDLHGNEFVAPRNDVEDRLAEIWKDVLEVDQVGVHDNFFELGGHSLLAVRLVSAIRKAFVVEMPISNIFDFPTVALLAVQLSQHSDDKVLNSIERVDPRPAHIPLSFSQERLWFIDRLEGSIQYHVPAVLRLSGNLNVEALNFALKTIVDRHEILRSVILDEDGHPYQQVNESGPWELSVVEGSHFREEKEALQDYIFQLIRKPFDLAGDYMIRATLIKTDVEEFLLIATLHHIASDGWSRSVLVKEVVELYNSFEEKRSAQLNSLSIQYADYAIWQRAHLTGEVFNSKISYWKDKLFNVAHINLPNDFKRPAVWNSRGAFVHHKVDKAVTGSLNKLSQQKGVTLFMTLLAAFKVLLHRYSGQEDICVGTPIAGRQQVEVEELIGFFVNTLALRDEVKSNATFEELLLDVRKTTLDAYQHQEVPFEKIVDVLDVERDVSRNPVFQLMFVLRNTPEVPDLSFGNVKLSAVNAEHTTAMFDIQLFITETADGLSIMTEYSTDLFLERTIRDMISQYHELLSSILKNPKETIGSLPILSKQEEHHLLHGLNKTSTDYPKDKTVVDLFGSQVLKTPDAIAVVFDESQYTYRQLDTLSNQLAHHLKDRGVEGESLVAICLERSLQMIVGIWGILKAGAAYLPIDPDYPEDRLKYMLEDSKVSLLITNPKSRHKIEGLVDLDIIELNKEFSIINNEPSTALNIKIPGNRLAYVIYTSGSTGRPKGAMNEHAALFNRLYWAQEYFNLTPDDAVLQKTTYCFDVSVWELLWPLLTGARLVFAKPGGQKDDIYLKALIEKNRISIMHFVPSMLAVFIPGLNKGDCSSLKKVLCSGEALKPAHADLFKVKLPDAEIHNLYGPTEAAIDVTCWSPAKDETKFSIVPIGKPVANTSIYILDTDLSPVPVGGTGEIYIGGVQVGRGYLNRPELTAEKFITDPFAGISAARMYKTGDLGRWMQDGNVEYLGRKDEQVKIRGYRIELGEIENSLQQSGMVKEAAVVFKTDKVENAKLVCYYVPQPELVKLKEKELYADCVANWKELYDTEYAKSGTDIPNEEFDLAGWNSSFTGEAIPGTEMKEWVDEIVDVIMSQSAGNVLEIGCGTGLVYFPLAGKVKKYIGTDISRTSISHISEKISRHERDYGPTEFHVCAAHDLPLQPGEVIDTIVLNSVVQYFPGEEYLNIVMGKSIELLKGKGRIIIGDVRDMRLIELFKGRLQAAKLQANTSISEFKWNVEQDVLKEEELTISPEYFFQLKNQYPEITHVEVKWKKASYSNELSLYRYTVVIYIGIQKEVVEPNWINWQDKGIKETLATLKSAGKLIGFKDVPNYRLSRERRMQEALTSQRLNTVGELCDEIEKEDEECLEVEQMLNDMKAEGYSYQLLLGNSPLKLNVVLEKKSTDGFIKPIYNNSGIFKIGSYTNIPLFTNIDRVIQKELKSKLQLTLPDYMIPSGFMALPHLPLNTNGKVDRKFLREREEKALLNKKNYQAPRTPVEQQLVSIWQELLGIQQVGIHDNFFELGGHSLLAIRLLAAIRKKLDAGLSVNDIFIHPTIADFAASFFDKPVENTTASENKTAIKHLVPLKTGGKKIPIYIVAGGGGTAIRFMKFAEMMDPDQPVFVLQPPVETIDVSAFPKTVEEISRKFIEEIFVQNPNGPYALSGHCAGGLFAFEMARQLKQMGKKVHLLAMFDTIIRSRKKIAPASIQNLYHIPLKIKAIFSKILLKINFESFLLFKHTRHAIGYKVGSFKKLFLGKDYKKKNKDELQSAGLEIFNESLELYQDACRIYELQEYDNELVLFYAKEHYYFTDAQKQVNFKKWYLNDETKNVWRKHAHSIKIYEVSGEHSTIFDPKYGNEFARILQSHLDIAGNN